MVKISLVFATLSSSLMLVSGDSNARMVAKQQPVKLAALEGHFQNRHRTLPALSLRISRRQDR